MSYNYIIGSTVFRNGEFNNVIGAVLNFTDLLPAAVLPLDGSVPAEVAIGNEIAIGGGITATAGDVWDEKQIRLNIAMFGATAGPSLSAYWQGAIPTVATGGVYFPLTYTGANAAQHQKIGVYVFRANVTDIGFLIVLKVTADLLGTVTGQAITNRNRFLKSVFSSTVGDLNNAPASAYRPIGGGDFITVRADIIDAETNLIFKTARNPANLDNFLTVPALASFYDAFPGGVASRYISSLIAKTQGATAAGLGPVADVSRTYNLGFNSIDPQYVINKNQLSPKEKNQVKLTIIGVSYPGAGINDPITSIRAILIRTDDINDNVYFFDDYEGMEGLVPASLPAGVIDGALIGPASWSENLAAFETYIDINIDGTQLAPGGEYRLIINTYDAANRRTGSHISPPLFASFVLPVPPPLTSRFYDYSEFYDGTALLSVAPHSRLKCELTIDITGYNAALAAAGYVGNFVFYAKSVFANLETKIEGVTFGGINPNVLTENAELTITPTEAVVSVVFRIGETLAGLNNVPIIWSVTIRQDDGAGGFVDVVTRYRQYIDVKEFDDDPADVLINTRFFKADNYPAIKTAISNICNVDRFVVEAEKNAAEIDGDIVAHIYPILPGDVIANDDIEEEAATPPVYLPVLNTFKIDNVNNFVGNFAAYEILTAGLDLDRCYNVTTLVKQFIAPAVDYCPLLPPTPPTFGGTIDKILNGPTWRVLSEQQDIYNYVVGLGVPFTVTKNQIEDTITGLPVGVGLIWGNPSTDQYRVYCEMPSIVNTVRVRYDIDFTIDLGAGPHVVRFSVDEVIQIPAAPGPWQSINAPYICDDLNF